MRSSVLYLTALVLELQTVHQTFPLLIIHSFLSYSLCSAALTLIFPLSFQKKRCWKQSAIFLNFFLCTKSFQGNCSIAPDSSNVWNYLDFEARVRVTLWKINQNTNSPIACNIFVQHVTFVCECCANFHFTRASWEFRQHRLNWTSSHLFQYKAWMAVNQ